MADTRGGPPSRRRTALVCAASAVLAVVACSDTRTPAPEANVLVGRDPASAGLGAQIYEANCAACHGGDGEGGFGPALVADAVGVAPSQVVDIVTSGRGAMPSFDPVLSDDEIRAVAEHVTDGLRRPTVGGAGGGAGGDASGSPRSGAADEGGGEGSPATAPPEADTARGAVVFERSCASCHGNDGDGSAVAPAIDDLSIGFDQVVASIRSGGDGMPQFSSILSSTQIRDVAAYVRAELGAGG